MFVLAKPVKCKHTQNKTKSLIPRIMATCFWVRLLKKFQKRPPNCADKTQLGAFHVSICIFLCLWPDSPVSCRPPCPLEELRLLPGASCKRVWVLISDREWDASAGWRLTQVKLGKIGRQSLPTGSLWTLRVLCWQSPVWSPTPGNVGPKIWTRGGTSPLWNTHSLLHSHCEGWFAVMTNGLKKHWALKKKTNKQTERKKKTWHCLQFWDCGEWSWPSKCSRSNWEGRWNRCAAYRRTLWKQIKTNASLCMIPRRLVIITISNVLLQDRCDYFCTQAIRLIPFLAIYINWCFEKAKKHVPI